MGLNPYVGYFSLLFLLEVFAAEAADFNVVDYGAVGDGVKDSTQAFIDTWKLACASKATPSYIVPKGSFRVGQVTFEGPCKGFMNFAIQGNIRAESDPSKFNENWIVFEKIKGMQLSGGGTFDGQGSVAWKKDLCKQEGKCNTLPPNARFDFIEDALITDITSLNSKQFHINILSCKNITFSSVTIKAPGDSPNTDGIHMGSSNGVNITNSVIATGDDCVSIGPGSQNVYVVGVTCGPGHGISVGSLGKYKNEEDVRGVTVRNCTITGASNGVRIKTWPKSPASEASDFIFDDIVMENVMNPINIDQIYCPDGGSSCEEMDPSKVKISDVTFNNIRGTSQTRNAIRIVCSKGVPCEDVRIGEVNLKYTGSDGPAKSVVEFADLILSGSQVPPVTNSAPNSS
ncbi:hypothetical protein C5167_009504 [Papaver somniferum]|uniref:Uncharacterized protein n=1 Tax=Papaver somniferum TaxID=3469 RepID=A0A4Y7JXL8_PAPSO|nr:exopolygalacturonase-like [Papaver somniferum]RZC65813.1 hypothetical protein C5167_009504 [Papaver somniferum]